MYHFDQAVAGAGYDLSAEHTTTFNKTRIVGFIEDFDHSVVVDEMERSEVWESGIVGIGVEKSLSGEGGVEDDSLKAHLGGYETGLKVAAKRFLTEFSDYVTGTVGSDSPIVGTLVDVAWNAVDKYLWRFMEERFHQPAGSYDELIFEPLVAPAEIAKEMVVGDIVGLEMTCCHVIACDKLTFGIVVEETDDTLG